jgi:hypothetical protein
MQSLTHNGWMFEKTFDHEGVGLKSTSIMFIQEFSS